MQPWYVPLTWLVNHDAAMDLKFEEHHVRMLNPSIHCPCTLDPNLHDHLRASNQNATRVRGFFYTFVLRVLGACSTTDAQLHGLHASAMIAHARALSHRHGRILTARAVPLFAVADVV